MNSGLRLLRDSGATCHVCPRDFGPQFYLDDSQGAMDGLPALCTANGKRLHQHGARSVSRLRRSGVAMSVSTSVCGVELPSVSVNRPRDRDFNTVLTHDTLHVENDGQEEQIA